jgi:hypothetical protein
MDEAASRLDLEISGKRRARLNEVAESVFTSHAGQPVEIVLLALIRTAGERHHYPPEDDLRPAAQAISRGRRFAYV